MRNNLLGRSTPLPYLIKLSNMRKTTPFLVSTKKLLATAVVALFALTSFAQNPYAFVFNGEYVTLEENIETFSWDQMPETSKLGGGYFGWIQFEQTPNQQIQDYFETNDLRLLDYVGTGTYLFYMAETTPISVLAERKVRAIAPVDGRFKMAPEILNNEIPDYALSGDRILVTLEYHDIVNKDFILDDLRSQQIEVVQVYDSANYMDLIIPDNCLESLSNSAYVSYVGLVPAPPVKEDVQGKSLHRSNGLDTQMIGGWNYTGAGVGVLVRDDGLIGPHIDFQGRIDNIPATSGGSHGDGVAGIFAGAGNLNPRYRGMAAGSDMYVSNYFASFLDSPTTSLISDGTVMITNSSYGDGCNGGYTLNARTVDQQTNDFESVLHVFSCGNSNGLDCGYGAGTQWGNITGGHKQGKNVIATANVFFDGSLVGSSSHGPARDGRIKPDITAHGQGHISTGANNTYSAFGGTSGASPGIAGVSAQLYELYADTHGGVMPKSGLVKGALLNTANDAGNVGPDFKFGWGIVNGLRAGKLLSEDRFIVESISNGELNTNTLTVPAGTTQMRIMIYWTDPAAAAGASTALINDLDLVVKDPSDTSYLPWVLDPTPDPVTLDLPATNGADHLNNMEQVLINDPVAGDYTVEVSGFDVPFGPQEYFILYEFIQENLTMVYPNFTETLVPGEVSVIHWDAINTTAAFDLEYTVDDGATWTPITTVSATTTNYSWTVPEELTGSARVRITSGTFSDESDNNFSIAPQVTGVEILQVCDTSMSITWDAVEGAENYDVYLLGEKYMEVVTNVTENWASIPITSATDDNWIAVAAKNDTDGWANLRTTAIKTDGSLNCDFANDLAVLSIDNSGSEFNFVCDASPVTVKTTIFNSSMNPQSGFEVSYQLDSDTPVTEAFTGTIEPGAIAQFSFATPLSIADAGNHDISVTVNLVTDEDSSNDNQTNTYFVATEASPISDFEDFQTTGFPSEGWYIDNPDGDRTWQINSFTVGSDGETTRVGFVDNFIYDAIGQLDAVVTEVYDLSGADVPGVLFDLAKAQRVAGDGDGLRVDVSTDCGTTWVNVYEKFGSDLSTIPGFRTTPWIPTAASDWRNEQIDLSAFIGEQIQLRFVNIAGNSNRTFIDNVFVLNNYLGTADNALTGISMYPNPTQGVFTIASSNTFETMDMTISNTLGQIVMTQNNLELGNGNSATVDVSGLGSGIYFVRLNAGGKQTVKKLVVR